MTTEFKPEDVTKLNVKDNVSERQTTFTDILEKEKSLLIMQKLKTDLLKLVKFCTKNKNAII